MEVKSSWNRWHHQRQFPHSRFVDVRDHGHHHHRHHHRYHHDHDQEIARDETVSKATAAAAQGVNRRRSNVVKEVKIITMIIVLIKQQSQMITHIYLNHHFNHFRWNG